MADDLEKEFEAAPTVKPEDLDKEFDAAPQAEDPSLFGSLVTKYAQPVAEDVASGIMGTGGDGKEVRPSRAFTLGASSGITFDWNDELGGLVAQLLHGRSGVKVPPTKEDEQEALPPGLRASTKEQMSPEWAQQRGMRTPPPQAPAAPNTGEEIYKLTRDRIRDEKQRAQEQNPKTYLGGELAGAVALPGGGAESAVRGVAQQGLKGLGKAMGETAALTGVGGAVQGLGASEGKTPSELEGDTLRSGLAGAALGGAAPVAGKIVKTVADPVVDWLKKFAEMRALKATGHIQKDIKQELKRGGEERLRKHGRIILDEPDFLGRFSKSEDLYQKAPAIAEDYGKGVGNVWDEADALTGKNFDVMPAVNRADQEIVQRNALNPFIRPQRDEVAGKLNEIVDLTQGYLPPPRPWIPWRLPKPSPGFRGVGEWVTALRNGIGQTDPNNRKILAKRLQNIFTDDMERQVGQAGGPDLLKKYLDVKNKYDTFNEVADRSLEGTARDLGNQWFSASDKGLGGLAAATGSVLGGAGTGVVAGTTTALANKTMRQRGPAFAARTFDDLAKALNTSPEIVARLLQSYSRTQAPENAADPQTDALLRRLGLGK